MRGTRLSGGFYACEGVDTSLMTAWQKSRNFGRRFALEGRFVGHGRFSGVVSQTRLFSREEFGGRGALTEERGCKSKDSGEVEAAAKFASQLVSAGTRRDKLSQSR